MSARQSSAVDRAMKLIDSGMTPYAAAKKTGIAMSTVYRAVQRNRKSTPVPQNGPQGDSTDPPAP